MLCATVPQLNVNGAMVSQSTGLAQDVQLGKSPNAKVTGLTIGETLADGSFRTYVGSLINP